MSHPKLSAFLGHIQRGTVDSQADVSRLSREMTIRRAKKCKYILNDTRIKACLRRFDDNVYTRLEFLKAVSHSMGAHSCDLYTESTDSYSNSVELTDRRWPSERWRRHRDRQLENEWHGNRYRGNAAVLSAGTGKYSENVAVIPR